MMILFSWLEQDGVNKALNLVYNVLEVIRIVVPIGLIIMTSIDIAKKVINPEEKEGQKKIMIRAIAALVVFFVPLLIKFVFNIGGMKEETLDDNGSNTSNYNQSGNNNNNNQNKNSNDNKNNNNLTSVSITNCPSSNQVYHFNDTLVLNTNIPASYDKTIIWNITKGGNYASITPTNNNLSATLKINKVEYDTNVTIQVVADGKSSTCNVKIEEEKLDDVKILNCDHSKRYIVGEYVSFDTSVPASFSGDVKWNIESDIMVIKDVSQKNKAVFQIIKRPTTGYSSLTVLAGGKADACTIDIASVKELSFDCPSENNIYHVGDRIHLKSNLPTSYNGTIEWNNGVSSPNAFSINPINNGIEAEVTILTKNNTNYGYVTLVADHDSYVCKIRIE